MPAAETLTIGDAVTVQVTRAATSNITSMIILTLFVIFIVGFIYYVKRR